MHPSKTKLFILVFISVPDKNDTKHSTLEKSFFLNVHIYFYNNTKWVDHVQDSSKSKTTKINYSEQLWKNWKVSQMFRKMHF